MVDVVWHVLTTLALLWLQLLLLSTECTAEWQLPAKPVVPWYVLMRCLTSMGGSLLLPFEAEHGA
jgi:hypothetical protein